MGLTVEKTASCVFQLVQVDIANEKVWVLCLIMVLRIHRQPV